MGIIPEGHFSRQSRYGHLTKDDHDAQRHRWLTYTKKMAAMATMPAATNEPLKVLAAPVKGVIGAPVGPGKTL